MNNYRKQTAIAAGILASLAFAGAGQAQTSDPLLNALIKKGVLTEQEAKQVQTEVKETSESPDTPKYLKINSAFKGMELYGDARFRYEYREAQTTSSDTFARERFRYALRAGIRGEAFDDFYYGIRLETSANPRSTWVTFGDEKPSATVSGLSANAMGPSGKNSDGINVGQAYAGWRATDWLEFTIGRMPNPLYTTPMVWDPDINPEGAAERLKHSFGNLDTFATFGQFLYQDVDPDNPAPGVSGSGNNKSDAFLLAWQLGAKYNFNKDISAKIAPTLYNYTGHGQNSGFNSVFIGQGNTAGANAVDANGNIVINQTGINDLLVVELPAEVDFKIGKYNARVFGDFALNLDGNRRATAAAAAAATTPGAVLIGAPQKNDDKAYTIGFAIGNVDLVNGAHPKKNTWEARAYWQHTEQYSVDVNLNDSDFFEGRGNLEGIYTAVAYALSDNVITTVRYGYADRINKSLGTGGSNADLPQINPATKYQLLQFDLTLKF